MGRVGEGQVSALGDSAVVVSFGDSIDPQTHARVLALSDRLRNEPPPAVIDHVPAYTTVTIHYDPLQRDHEDLAEMLRELVLKGPAPDVTFGKDVEIPVCYGGELGPDLDFVASHSRIHTDEVIRLHSSASYAVYMIGFAPGFPYLGGLPSELATPRLDEPRAIVPAGSVGIAGRQTGIYPIATPGGWRVIGRTPVPLFDAAASDPSVLHAGDRVRFRAIDRQDFDRRSQVAAPDGSSDTQIELVSPGVRVIDGGLMSTVQDLGRFGHQHVGVTPSGALDQTSHSLANALVGNEDNAATIEVTVRGPTLEFTRDTRIAISGADLSPTISDVAVPSHRAIAVRAGAVLAFGRVVSGARCHVAVAGGFDVPLVMGSRSTYIRAGIGGHRGRALQPGDELAIGSAGPTDPPLFVADAPVPFALTDRSIDRRLDVRDPALIRMVRGPDFEMLSDSDRFAFRSARFDISPRCDRMGYRLDGPRLSSVAAGELLSTGVTSGTIQVPPSGEPIILMADRQTTGGYPMIANVITADLYALAQMKPGDRIRFEEVTVEEAQQIVRDQERVIERAKEAIAAGASHRSEL